MPWNWEPEVPAAAPPTGDRRRAKSVDAAIGTEHAHRTTDPTASRMITR